MMYFRAKPFIRICQTPIQIAASPLTIYKQMQFQLPANSHVRGLMCMTHPNIEASWVCLSLDYRHSPLICEQCKCEGTHATHADTPINVFIDYINGQREEGILAFDKMTECIDHDYSYNIGRLSSRRDDAMSSFNYQIAQLEEFYDKCYEWINKQRQEYVLGKIRTHLPEQTVVDIIDSLEFKRPNFKELEKRFSYTIDVDSEVEMASDDSKLQRALERAIQVLNDYDLLKGSPIEEQPSDWLEIEPLQIPYSKSHFKKIGPTQMLSEKN